MSRDREALCADVFAEGEEGVVALEIFDRRFVILIDFDLFDAGIALDVEDAVAAEEIGIEFLGATDVEDRIGFTVKLPDPVEGKAGRRIAGQVSRAKTPAPAETEFGGEMPEQARGIIELVVYFKGLGVVRKPGGIFDVENIMPESLESDDVME